MLKSQLKNFNRYKGLLKQLVARDLKTRYRRSFLGYLWTILNPLGMMIILSIVFSSVFKQGIDNFPVYLMCGQLIFNFFNEATMSAMGGVLDNSALLSKVYVPKYLFPLSRVCSSGVNLIFSLGALFIVIAVTGFKLSWTALFMVFPILYVGMFSLGVGMILCTVVVFFRDMKHLYSVLTTAWIYVTPVFYPLSMLPDQVKMIVKCNPLTMYVEMFRETIMYNTIPSFEEHIQCIVVSGLIALFGIYVFKKNQNKFILYF